MKNNKDNDLTAKCKEQRQRRINMWWLASSPSTGGFSPPANQSQKENQAESSSSAAAEMKRIRTAADMTASASSKNDVEASAVGTPIEAPAPVSVPALAPAVAEPVFGTISMSGRSRDMEDAITMKISLCRPEITGRRPVHFFGLYDGHGGAHVTALCRETMHVFFEEELMHVNCTDKGKSCYDEGSSSNV